VALKTCPSCGGEFQSWVARCPDCDVALGSGPPPQRPAPPPEPAFPPAAELHCLRRGDVWYLREIAEHLAQEGIASRIDADPDAGSAPRGRGRGRGPSLGLYVRPEDAARAAGIDHDYHVANAPDTGAARGPGEALEACPACGERLAEDARECPGCGLEFPAAPRRCPGCAAWVVPEDERCPACGAPFASERTPEGGR
jgi:hypothetical protein